MNNILNLPSSTFVGKLVPKNAFYKHLELNARMKQHFVDDVVRISWLYKIAPSTVNVTDGSKVHEIVIFSAELKSEDCPDDVFVFIDQNMPRHVVFILEFEDKYKVLLNYKEWKDAQSGQFKIVKTFATEWLSDEELSITLEGQSMDAVYEIIAGQVSGFGTSKSDDTKQIIELESLITKGKREIEALQKKIRSERQLNRQIELNGEARSLKRQLANWQNELNKLKQ